MKKNYILIVYAIALAVFFVLTGAFAVGTIAAPETYWLASIKESNGSIEDSSFTLDLDRTYKKVGEDGKETTEHHKVCGIYVYIGKVYSANENGEVELVFDFKSKSSADTSYEERVKASTKSFYSWQKVYGSEEGFTGLDRVKIHTPSVFELCEVAFTAEDGSLIKIDHLVAQSDTTKSSAARVLDEQATFTSSSAYIYNLTEDEKLELEAADALFGGGEAVGRAPLSTLLNAISVSVFGRNTFGIRFFSLVAGYISLIILYLLIRRLFANDYAALCGSLLALLSAVLFSGAVTATSLVSLPFILLAYYTAIGFYAERYKFSPKWSGVKNLVLCGFSVGLALSSGASNIISLIGIPVIWGFALYKLHAEYKKAYEQAKGLDKEIVYAAYNDKKATCAWFMPTVYILLPAFSLLLFYAINYLPITTVYGSFFGGIIKDMGKSFNVGGSFTALGALIGYGSETAGVGYKLMNYLPHCVALVGFILTTTLAVLQKNEKFKGAWRGIKNKYIMTTIITLSAYLPLVFGINLSLGAVAVFSCAYIVYILLGLTATEKMFGKEVFKWAAIAIMAVCGITFIGCYFGIFGFGVPETLKNILYTWQV